MMQVPVGPYRYRIDLVPDRPLDGQGNRCLGTCDTAAQVIRVSRDLPPAKRIAVLWHEIAHAWQAELDIHESPQLTAEAACNLVGLAMASMPPSLVARLHLLMTTGEAADDAVVVSGRAVPVREKIQD